MALIVPVPYETFTNSSSALNNAGGHWYYESRWPNLTQDTRFVKWCDGQCIHIVSRGVCDSCQAAFGFYANVTVDMNDYPNATSLAYDWEYSPAFCDSRSATGQQGEISLTIGDQVTSDAISSVPCPDSTGQNTPGWSGDPVTHSGNATLLRYKSMGYIPINVTFLKTNYASDRNLTWYFKNIHFKITTPTGVSQELPSQPSTPSEKTNPAAIIPAVVVPVVVAILALIGFFFWRNRRMNSKTMPFQKVELGDDEERNNRVNMTNNIVIPTPQLQNNGPVFPFLIPPEAGSSATPMNSKFHSNHSRSTQIQNQAESQVSMDPTDSQMLSAMEPTRNPTLSPDSPSVYSGITTLPPPYTKAPR